MVFSSETFLFLFLPLFLALYYLTPARLRSLTLLAGSYAFYGWWRLDFLGLLILTTLWTYWAGQRVRRSQGRARRAWTGLGVAGCLAVLATFKYLNFFVDSFAALIGTDAAGLGMHWRVILPIGISFYVFQSISYLVDTHRGDADEEVGFLDFAAFIALFPQLIAGPILRFKDLAWQFRHRTHTAEKFTDGMMLFFVGLAKKVLLADSVAPLADLAFATPDPSLALAVSGSVAYMMQLYFDFSGYSLMAIGLGLMMGFRFVQNFDTPYISRSITEFWRRWHISLSIWLRDYLYIPLGGNRVGPVRTYGNLMAVMVLGGLWHGAAWTFVIWGFWHGGWLAIERATGLARATGTAALVRTMIIVLLGWVVFRATSLDQALGVYEGMLGLNGLLPSGAAALAITQESLMALLLCIAVVAAEPWLKRTAVDRMSLSVGEAGLNAVSAVNTVVPTMLTGTLAVLAVLKLAEQTVSPFLYFQF
ncbi:MBOAT family O-acyltransferase [Jannaschia formosa]|uniref:MBOAT family O-acyltransferase n=1 Tax=Jannaschia formosa TaxID=2259592 RepID=UPI000E1BF522|nr:MBOAT family protein [Jannaschia formosa]TFL16186.1 MBOAT family protein [Jannaschia formosa]